jgi:hydrogenase/urease accessory protein HupE
MKKFLIVLLISLSHFLQTPLTAQAHDVISADILEYVKTHPDLTAQELDEYIQQKGGQISDNPVKSGFSTQETATTLLGVKEGEQNLWTIILTFIRLGIEHILIGLDHILFVFSLLLVFTNVKTIIKLFTAFTIAHSTTLILSGTGILVLSSRVVEPLIALSIAYVAITTVFVKESQFTSSEWSKILMVFFFGLFHGLGFAGLLTDFSIPSDRFLSSLISFNVGIELGQVVILAIALPIIYLFYKKSWYPRAIQIFSVMISIVALLWFVERVFQISIISS